MTTSDAALPIRCGRCAAWYDPAASADPCGECGRGRVEAPDLLGRRLPPLDPPPPLRLQAPPATLPRGKRGGAGKVRPARSPRLFS